MFKNILVLALACGFSMSASAGYVQYDLNASFDDGTSLTGMFVQNTDNAAISFYSFATGSNTYLPGSDFWTDSGVTAARITVPGGPTSFDAWSTQNGQNYSTISLRFAQDGSPGQFAIQGFEVTEFPVTGAAAELHSITTGIAQRGQIDADLLALLESGNLGWTEVVPPALPEPEPEPVPEPASWLLVAAGAYAMRASRQRVKRAA